MRSFIVGKSSNNLNTSTGYFINPFSLSTATTVEEQKTWICPASGTLENLKIVLDTAPGSSTSRTFTVYKNGVSQSLAVTISNTDTSASDTSNTVSVSAGDRIAVASDVSGTPAASTYSFSLEFDSTNTGESFISGKALIFTTSDTFACFYDDGSAQTTEQGSFPYPHDSTIKAFYVRIPSGPGGSGDYDISILKNGSVEATSTVNLTGATETGSATGLSINVSPGDRLAIKTVINTSGSNNNLQYGVLFAADTDGQSAIGFSDTNGSSTLVTRYYSTLNVSDSLTEANTRAYGSVTSFTLKNMYGYIEAAYGSGSFTYTTRKNGADTSLAFTISDPATTGNDTTDTVDITSSDDFSISAVPSSAGSSRGVGVAFTVEVTAAAATRRILYIS